MHGALRRYAARVEAAPQLSFVIPAFEVRHTAAPHRPEAAAAAVEEEEEVAEARRLEEAEEAAEVEAAEAEVSSAETARGSRGGAGGAGGRRGAGRRRRRGNESAAAMWPGGGGGGGSALPRGRVAKDHMAKGHLRALVASGRAVPFASRQYALGHACDQPRKWLGTRKLYETAYRLGCEPYLLLSRRHAPPYPEDFVGYGKDRVSYTYELAARGARLHVQPEVFLVHYTTLQRGTAYSHSPKDWMVGDA